MRAATCALAAGLALAGCMNLAPRYEQPVAPIPAAWPAGAQAVEAPQPLPDWRAFFQDERLRALVRLALANNRDLRVAALNIERAQALYGVTSAAQLPSIGATGGATRARTPAGMTTSGQSRVADSFTVNLGFTAYELDLFGRVRNLSDAALQTFFATEDTRRSVQIGLVAAVAQAWLQLAGDQQRLQLARETLASQRQSYDLIRQAHALGAQSGVALAQSQTTVETARGQVAAYEALVEQDGNALALLAGATPPPELLPAVAAVGGAQAQPSVALLPAPPAGLPSSVLRQRPDVLAAEHALQAAHHDVGAARAALYPRISLTATAGLASPSLSSLFEAGSRAFSLGPSLSLPILDGGASRNAVRAAEVQREIQLAQYEKTLQVAFREVADALAERGRLAERLDAQRALVAASARSFELAQALFKGGSGSYLEVLDAQRALYAAQQALIGLQQSEQANRITLYKVLGGGWQEEEAAAAPSATRG
ncbi:efflux transporter outer membrane subunit [Pseudorhodoferax sp.]|uniref:efflux transporter outer membrane subunit n=1 Tax=Pseudorhodoferax sp. TaxID=1993553 RepID=UPI0039E7081C